MISVNLASSLEVIKMLGRVERLKLSIHRMLYLQFSSRLFPSSQAWVRAGKIPSVVRPFRCSNWVWKSEIILSSPVLLGTALGPFPPKPTPL